MPWLQMKLDIEPQKAEAYEDLLLALGCCAVTLEDGADQPLFEPELGTTPLWDKTRITGLFDAETDLQQLQQGLRTGHQQIAPDNPFPSYKTEILEDKDWEREWMENFHPMRFGERLWVCPSWKEVPDPTAANLMLDPGLAFGTGTHPTTALCLEWLDAQDCNGAEVIDYGCGSGILGIAALLLGASKLVATDIDPQALQASLDNAQRNQIDPKLMELYYPDKMPELEADILVANILAGPLVELAPVLAKLVKSGGKIALSGVLESQAEALMEAYQPWFDLQPATQREEWMRLTGVKR
ncbi:MAG: 50S ribosomal protein L11 methyltransferase [Motiliproteus sp.]|nr:50S ribosomal protein L11 methyltransferase [Motiliproteus sp.]MCW9053868.1 50S ribosomal protein L11 methyltransferase [Motiliproteus sp.]